MAHELYQRNGRYEMAYTGDRVGAERALVELAPQERPTLSDDVIVLGYEAGLNARLRITTFTSA